MPYGDARALYNVLEGVRSAGPSGSLLDRTECVPSPAPGEGEGGGGLKANDVALILI